MIGPGERRNLASECLGLVARELPRLWLRKFRYRPLLAETFCDIERTAGTCYKAAGWIPLGQTQGQQVIRNLAPAIAALAATVCAGSLADIGGCALRADIASMLHETQYTRLFRS